MLRKEFNNSNDGKTIAELPGNGEISESIISNMSHKHVFKHIDE